MHAEAFSLVSGVGCRWESVKGEIVDPHLEPSSAWVVLEDYRRCAEVGGGVGGIVANNVNT